MTKPPVPLHFHSIRVERSEYDPATHRSTPVDPYAVLFVMHGKQVKRIRLDESTLMRLVSQGAAAAVEVAEVRRERAGGEFPS